MTTYTWINVDLDNGLSFGVTMWIYHQQGPVTIISDIHNTGWNEHWNSEARVCLGIKLSGYSEAKHVKHISTRGKPGDTVSKCIFTHIHRNIHTSIGIHFVYDAMDPIFVIRVPVNVHAECVWAILSNLYKSKQYRKYIAYEYQKFISLAFIFLQWPHSSTQSLFGGCGDQIYGVLSNMSASRLAQWFFGGNFDQDLCKLLWTIWILTLGILLNIPRNAQICTGGD